MPESLDAVSTELVLRRAFELARVEQTEPLVGIGRQTLAEIAAEVDLPVQAVAAALAERQLRVEAEADSLLDRLVGPARVASRRSSVNREPEAAERAREWFDSAHGLRPRTTVGGVVVAKKRSDVVGKVARTVRDVQGQGRLGKLRQVEFVAVDIADEPGAMAVAADLGDQRRSAVLGGVAVSAGTATAVGVGAVVFGPFVLLGLPVAAGAGTLTSRLVHQQRVRETTADLEEFLDDIARDEPPPTLLKGVTDRLTRSLRRRSR